MYEFCTYLTCVVVFVFGGLINLVFVFVSCCWVLCLSEGYLFVRVGKLGWCVTRI